MVRLKAKQEAFAQAVVRNGGDKVKAREEAGYSMKMSKAAQSVDADNLFNHPKISLRIAELQSIKDEIVKKELEIDSMYVLRRCKEIDELDIADIVKDDLSGFKSVFEWPKPWRTLISGIDLKRIIDHRDGGDIETLISKIKWPDKVKNLEMIGRHVTVKAWDREKESSAAESVAASLAKIIENMPS